MEVYNAAVKCMNKELEPHFIVGKEYRCTAYLPQDKKFAVFGETTWITFDWTEEEFLKSFEILEEGKL